ncbi:rhomboid family intramembrane serine protease [Saccharicrinis sp. FJH62]|uniref:rhomboid family intramembrane serine protease n=1 Tax=Saccharicrinis sp. FJH62 TaxID=3344657 RepID=UPI0035D3E1DE
MMLIGIIVLTALVSAQGFRDNVLLNKLSFNPHKINYHREYYRVFSHGLVHADWMHLGVNMFVLYMFANSLENQLSNNAHLLNGTFLFTLLYVTALPVSSAVSYKKHKDNPYYTAIGASGAVSAVVFANIFYDPWNLLYFFGIIPIPGIIFGAGYLYYSYYMSRKNIDNVGHDAHFWGAVYGFIFPVLIHPGSIFDFISKLNPF